MTEKINKNKYRKKTFYLKINNPLNCICQIN